MRKVSFGLALGFLASVAACGGGETTQEPKAPVAPVATTPAPAPTATETAKVEAPKAQPSLAELEQSALKSYSEAMNAHDSKKLAALYADSAVVNVAGTPAEVKGKDAIGAQYQKLFDAFSNFKTASSRVFTKGDVVVVEWAWTGTHTGEMGGIKATEKPVGSAGADVFWFTPEGLIKEQHTYYDMGTIMSQMGVSKQKGRPVPTLASSVQAVTSTGAPEEAKNAEAVNKMFGAFEKKSEADFLGNSVDDVAWDDMTQPEASKGKAAAKKFFGEMTKAFPDGKSTATNTWAIGDFVVMEGTFTGTHKGPLFGIPATKKSVNMHGLDVVQFKDGKVIKGTSYGNGLEVAMQLGLVPPPGAKPADPKAAPSKDAKPADKAATPKADPKAPAKK